MTKIDWFSRRTKGTTTRVTTIRVARSLGIAALMMMVGFATAQDPAKPAAPEAPQAGVEYGYAVHHTVDLGGHMVGVIGSGAMYDTLVNIQSGPRVLGQSLTLHALPGTKHPLFDELSAFGNGFGGDPINFAKLDVSKGKLYEFNGIFRRDRQYFDYDLLANPNIPSLAQPYGIAAGVPTGGSFQWQQVNQSPVMFNTVRRMTDTNMTILPISTVTFRVGYSQNIFQGPSMSPGRSIGKNIALLAEYQRNSSDDFTGAIDWKPLKNTKITFEEFVDHYKADSYFTLASGDFNAQEADGTLVALGNYDLQTAPKAAVGTTAATPYPYGIANCNTGSMGTAYTSATTYTIFTSGATTPTGLPIINPACDVASGYLRLQPTRTISPTEVLRFQSSSIKNIATNGDFRYSVGSSNMANYYENFQGLDGAIRSATIKGNSFAQRRVVSLDYGLTWDATKTITLSDQVSISNVHQPGIINITSNTSLTAPTTAGNETINYAGTLTPGSGLSITGNPSAGVPDFGYFGQKYLTNNATVSWDPSAKFTSALTYRYQTHTIIQAAITNTATGITTPGYANQPFGLGNGSAPNSFLVGIDTQAAILNLTYRPSSKWSNSGSVEISYSDNALTPVEARQLQHYRFHTLYKPVTWATISAAFNDMEKHNNTSNTGNVSADGPLQHVDRFRNVSLGLVLAPTEKLSIDANYSYTDVYTSTNICYVNVSSPYIAGTATVNAAGGASVCPDATGDWGPTKDFMDAPTQYASFGATYTPNKIIRTGAGYRISAVSGNQFFVQAQEVNGSLQSAYQTPYVNFAYTVRPNWIWRAEYSYYGYGEGGPSGPQNCSTTLYSAGPPAVPPTVVPCQTLPLQTGLTEPSSGLSAPRNFHANVLTVAMHYEF